MICTARVLGHLGGSLWSASLPMLAHVLFLVCPEGSVVCVSWCKMVHTSSTVRPLIGLSKSSVYSLVSFYWLYQLPGQSLVVYGFRVSYSVLCGHKHGPAVKTMSSFHLFCFSVKSLSPLNV